MNPDSWTVRQEAGQPGRRAGAEYGRRGNEAVRPGRAGSGRESPFASPVMPNGDPPALMLWGGEDDGGRR
ncbi:MAG: hypothetical protein JW951_05535 [Lentisphaerae bacterium]|nr:hypothetical protein [Lentisphaerota bacterium]